ncbi:MAG: hypothetical protein VB853_04605, partial [Pirellulales bacterium]
GRGSGLTIVPCTDNSLLSQTLTASEYEKLILTNGFSRDEIAEVDVDGEVVVISHSGDRQSEVALLREIVESGYPVAEFQVDAKSLEDVFLHVTEGRVQ